MRASTAIKLPAYGCELRITVVESVATEALRLYKKYSLDERFEDEAEGALVMPDSTIYYLLLNKSYLTHNTIAHEVFHAAVRMTEDRDITDEEAQAWLAGHISGVIYKFLHKKKLQIKHG